MAQVTVTELAKTVGASIERLLTQMKEAGLPHVSADEEVSDDRLKNAADTKKLAIFDALEILNRIEEENAMLDGKPLEKEEVSFKGFAERRSK